MSLLQAIILGIIQGLTEFIPVSSSGHLVLAHHFLNTNQNALAFDAALNIGTLAALFLFFGKDLWEYAHALFVKSAKTKLTYMLIAATIPAAIVGFLLESAAKSTFRSAKLVACNLILVGLVMLLAEWFYSRQKATHTKLEDITPKQALTMGLAQAAAIVPGVSRSGSTIMTGLFVGIDRVAATRFSFLLGIPILSGGVLKLMLEGTTLQDVAAQKSLFAVGIVTAFLSGLVAIRFMLKYLSGHGLHLFAYYRIVMGSAILAILFLG